MLSLGITVETLHGFKAGLYLDVSNQTRRLMWTLAHAHGTLLSVLNLVFATSIQRLPEWNGTARTLASRCLLGALVVMPLGFWRRLQPGRRSRTRNPARSPGGAPPVPRGPADGQRL